MSERVDQPRFTEVIQNLDVALRRIVEKIGQQALAQQSPYIIGLCGPSSSGKSTVSHRLAETLPNATVVGMDRYLSERLWDQTRTFNHDSPDPNRPYVGGISPEIWDMELMVHDLRRISRGESVEMPVFSEEMKDRVGYETFTPGNFVVVEGGHTFSEPFSGMIDYKILIDASLHDRLVRKLFRTCVQYGLDEGDEVISRYLRRDEPVHRHYLEERKAMADVVVNNPLFAKKEFQQRQKSISFTDTVPLSRLHPNDETGILRPGEELMLHKYNNREILSFWLEDNPVVGAPIAPSTRKLLLEHYSEDGV